MENENAVDHAYGIIRAAQQGAISYEDATWLWEYIADLGHMADSYVANWDAAERRIASMKELINE